MSAQQRIIKTPYFNDFIQCSNRDQPSKKHTLLKLPGKLKKLIKISLELEQKN